MNRKTLPINALPAWAKAYQIEFEGISVQPIPCKGYGLTVTAPKNENNALLMTVPRGLLLSLENVWLLAKADKQLRDVLEAAGDYARTARGAILIFLMLQITPISCFVERAKVGLTDAFTSYVQFLPSHITIPTFWNTYERTLLGGTSLEAALEAKLNALDREFAFLRKATAQIPWCQQSWWNTENRTITLDDWKLVDAMYRSRALDLPGTGHAMVPCIDFANHASGDSTVATYDTDTDGNAVLVVRDGKSLKLGSEVTITYGDEKGACEMLFSYGFLEGTMTSARELFLDLDIPDDDPLKVAKKHVSNSPPGFRIFDDGDSIGWEGPFVWLLCVNEEDGLEFKLLQSMEAEQELKVFWNDNEMADVAALQALLQADPKWDIFQLRAAVILRDRLVEQRSALEGTKSNLPTFSPTKEKSSSTCQYIRKLRDLEEALMLKAHETLENKINSYLLRSEVVRNYLGAATAENETQQDDDFS